MQIYYQGVRDINTREELEAYAALIDTQPKQEPRHIAVETHAGIYAVADTHRGVLHGEYETLGEAKQMSAIRNEQHRRAGEEEERKQWIARHDFDGNVL